MKRNARGREDEKVECFFRCLVVSRLQKGKLRLILYKGLTHECYKSILYVQYTFVKEQHSHDAHRILQVTACV